jgi:hypothetical protein
MSNLRNVTRLTALTLAASVALYAGACSSDADPSNAPEGPHDIDLEGVVYIGGANDEGLRLLLDAALKASPTPVFTAPEAGVTLEAPTTFSYHAGEGAELELRPRGARPRSSRGFARELAQLLGREQSAFAHGAPMNGPGYLLTFASADNPKVLRVFTDQTSYLPDETEWQALVAAADELTVSVRLAVFDEGRLASSGGGPFESGPLAFSIVVP